MNSNIFMIIMEIVAFIGFLLAANLAFLNFKKTRKVSNLWLLITIALFLFSISSLIYALGNHFQSLLNLIDTVRDVFLIIAATLLFSAIISYQKEDALIKDGLDGKVKQRDGKRFEKMEEWLKTI